MKYTAFEKNGDNPLYVQLYYYFRKLIESGVIEKDTKMMSIRRCCEEFGLSKTTVENAYLQLAAEGYIMARPQSGYYVCEINYTDNSSVEERTPVINYETAYSIRYDFTASSVESSSFDFSLWQRYIKSALRQSERLISYGEAQGESDLRNAVSLYAAKNRSVICNSNQVVVSAGTQNLLGILCSVIPEKSNIAFIGSSFEKGEAIFNDHGFKCFIYEKFPEKLDELIENNIKLIYISPSHFTKEGDILPIKQRIELLNFARKNSCLIIEDDYDSEFRYYSKSIPSLQGISGGNEVVYISTFSKLLIPSIRISFMILPFQLLDKYKKRGSLYNQTASKLEQIALCQFIRDGHLNVQIKKQRKMFSLKAKALCEDIKSVFGEEAEIKILPAGYLIKIIIRKKCHESDLNEKLKSEGVSVTSVNTDENLSFILSCTGVSSDDNTDGLKIIKSVIDSAE